MADAWPVLHFYQGGLTLSDYLAMPGDARRGAIEYMTQVLEARKQGNW